MSAEKNYNFDFNSPKAEPQTEVEATPTSTEGVRDVRVWLLEPGQYVVGYDSPIDTVTPNAAQGQKYIVTLEDGTEIPVDSDESLPIGKGPNNA